jgi:HEAT repeat protein
MANEKLIADIQSDDKEVRFTAWRAAGDADASAIAELGKLVASSNPAVAKAAREAITTMVHAVGKDAGDARRGAVVKELMGLGGAGNPLAVRVLTCRLLSDIAPEAEAGAIAKWLADADVREEAIYCLERIPGESVNKVLVGAYRAAPDEFKPRILAALGHRRAGEAVGLCVAAMRSPNANISGAAVSALGRIGKKPAGAFQWPKGADVDAMLRYADHQREQGNGAEAMRIYQAVMGRPEEHLQCAAVIGLARLGTPEAAAAVYPMLKSGNRKVRLTAAKAWKGMAG